ncbi:MAG: phthalate 4,5-dioxygenase [Chloroflexi bacterium]|nr:phthalate 4,5-dioxygenase [Chloroflexota bacterium]
MLTKAENDLLTQTGPGTPGGQFMRRYWQPVALSAEIPAGGAPIPVRLLSEDLVLFRDEKGQPGLLGLHCSHRGADLSYGRIEDGGLRCIYHGWLYDRDGRCLEQPGEPAGSTFHERVRHMSYPCQEVADVIFAYLRQGEPPLIPAYEALHAPADHRWVTKYFNDCNYLQGNDGNADAAHVPVLHGFLPGSDLAARQPKEASFSGPNYVGRQVTMLEIDSEDTDYGTRIFHRQPDGRGDATVRIMNMVLPNLCAVPGGPAGSGDGYLIYWHVPIDDEHSWRYAIAFKRSGPLDPDLGRRRTSVMTPDYHLTRNKSNRYLQDREEMRTRTFSGLGEIFIVADSWATETPGQIQDRTQEHLGTIDRAIIAWHRRMLAAIRDCQEGRDPPHVVRSPEHNDMSHVLVRADAADPAKTLDEYRQQANLRREQLTVQS